MYIITFTDGRILYACEELMEALGLGYLLQRLPEPPEIISPLEVYKELCEIEYEILEKLPNSRKEYRIPRTIGKPCKGFGPKKTMRIRNICKS